MKKNKKWFTLMVLLIFVTIFTMVFLVLISYSHKTSNSHYVAYKKIQASNYAVEGMELLKWYYYTEINKDKINGWKDNILPLSWKYVVWFDWEYKVISGNSETIEVNEPYVVDYVRTVYITEWDSIDEKKITVTVDYWEYSNVSFETSLVNLYWQ